MGYLVVPAIIVIIIIAILGWVISTSNRFKVLLVKISEADSGIDVALTKRYDTLMKMMDVTRAYAKHEVDTLTKMVQLRSGMSVTEKGEASRKLSEASDRLNVIAEAYPELRSSENYRVLQDAILDSEDHLQAARRVYNMNVSSFNQSIAQFPASVIANSSHYVPKDFFEADEVKRKDVEIKL